MARIGIASIMQETNTWSPRACELDDFACHGLAAGPTAMDGFWGTNTELAGAAEAVAARGHEPVPLVRAWASSSGRLTVTTLDELCALLVEQIKDAAPLDGLVLALHGAMAAEGVDDADAAVVDAARAATGVAAVIGVCVDLHANVTPAMLRNCDSLVGYRTYPHTDQASTGARAAALVVDAVTGRARPTTVLAKRPMLVPAEAQSLDDGPMRKLRAAADAFMGDGVLDISLFPVQPWLDVEGLGFGVTVTVEGDRERGVAIAEELADMAWDCRHDFSVDLLAPADAIALARASDVRPFLLSESADSPTAGAAGDSPRMLHELAKHGKGLRSYVTVVDEAGAGRCHEVGVGGSISMAVGASIDHRFCQPFLLEGRVACIGDDPVVLTGPSFTGMKVSMGRYAVVWSGDMAVLLTERPALTIDPATFVHVGLDPADADVVVVRSATLYRAAYPPASAAASVTLDVPGASTPRLDRLEFTRAPRPLHPVDA
ncbi:MAG: hypothetical protein QOI20_2960 [Acidimicrobiaceae bacterium]|jgi:microcystin degradation protein MlrC|nr:hypothetical protein [Acidimicrobiaceae bacterium]